MENREGEREKWDEMWLKLTAVNISRVENKELRKITGEDE
jgi:hypothetical protein